MNWYKKAQSNPNEVMWDAENGIGQTPNNQDIDYFGWITYIPPQEFRNLVLPGVSNEPTADFAIQAVKEGKKFGQPMLYLEWLENEKKWIVTGHEGRSRSIAFEKLFPNAQMEVHMFPNGLRSRNLTPEMKSAPILSESEKNQRDEDEAERYKQERNEKTEDFKSKYGYDPNTLM